MDEVTSTPYVFRAYGCAVASDWAVPFLAADGASPDIVFRRDAALDPPRTRFDESAWYDVSESADGTVRLFYPSLFACTVSSDGREVRGRELGTASAGRLNSFAFTQALSFALVLRGVEPFHATALTHNGSAFVLLADCGVGKSTLATALMALGCQLLTDDMLVLRKAGAEYWAEPGPPQIKLFPEVAASIFGYTEGEPMNEFTPKRIFQLRKEWACPRSAPLAAIFVLAPSNESSTPEITGLAERTAFLHLTHHAFNTRIRNSVRLARQFEAAARVCRSAPVLEFRYPRTLDSLERCARFLLEHFTNLPRATI